MHGALQAAQLFWKNLTTKIKSCRFTINPYDWCVASKSSKGKQCTVLRHVENIKISHVDSKVLMQIKDLMKGAFGRIHVRFSLSLDYR